MRILTSESSFHPHLIPAIAVRPSYKYHDRRTKGQHVSTKFKLILQLEQRVSEPLPQLIGNIFPSSKMGIFLVSHLPSWFVRYACLKQPMFVHSATSRTENSNKYHGLQKTYQRLYHISLESYFCQLKWVSHGFSFGSLV